MSDFARFVYVRAKARNLLANSTQCGATINSYEGEPRKMSMVLRAEQV